MSIVCKRKEEIQMNIMLISFSKLPIYKNAIFVQTNELSKFVNAFCLCANNVECRENSNVEFLEVDVPGSPNPSMKSMSLFNKQKKKIIDFIKEKNIDYIYFISKHTWNFFLIKSIKKLKIKIIHAFHDPVGHNGDKVSKSVLLYNKIVVKNINHAIVFSDGSYDDFVKYLKPKCKVNQLPFIQIKWPEYKETNFEKKNILFFGRLNKYKGIEFIPNLAKEVYKLDPSIKFIVAGKKSGDVDESVLNDMKALPNIELNNEFIPDKQIEQLFDSSLFCILPYKSITQSGVLIDAYSRSKTICAFDIKGISQFANSGNAILIKPFDLEEMAKQIVFYANNKELLNEKSKKAWLFGKKYFSALDWAQNFIKLVSKEVGNK